MDKRAEGTKPAAPAEGGKRRQGLADKDTIKGKKTQSYSEDLSVAPVEEQAKTKCINTYRLESRNKFRDCLVKDKAQQILTSKLQQAKYDGVSSPSLCASISEEILKAVKEFGFDRYKLPADASGMFKETLGFQLNVKLKHLLRWLW